MGFIFLARDRMLDRPVALKVMKPEAATPDNRERFFREARAIAALAHDHIVPIFQVGEESGIPYLVMPVLSGESLEARLARDRKPPLKEVVRIAREISLGLVAAHERGLIHRDIKPGNIWLESPRGRVRILDFGLVRNRYLDVRITHNGAIMGTPSYMSPEQASGKDVDARADLFSLGVVLYEMLTGIKPFKGPDTLVVLSALLKSQPLAPATLDGAIPEELSRFTMALLAKHPEDRPSSAFQVAQSLKLIQKMESESPGKPLTTSADPKPPPQEELDWGNPDLATPIPLAREPNPHLPTDLEAPDAAQESGLRFQAAPQENERPSTMSSTNRIICSGCGQTLDPALSGGKPKLRCPGCGVMVDLRDQPGYRPGGASSPTEKKKTRSAPEDQENPFEGTPFEANPFPEEPKKAKEKRPRPKPEPTPAARAESNADPLMERNEAEMPPPLPFAPAPPSFATSQEDDGLPYAMPGGFDFPCPDCTMLLKPGTVICTRCGFDMRTGKKKRLAVKAATLSYGPGISPKTRALVCFLIPTLMMVLMFVSGNLNATFLIWNILSFLLLTFIVGTWYEFRVERNTKNRTTFYRTIRVGFIPISGGVYDADHFDGITARMEEQTTFVDYIVFVSLLLLFILPGVLFYFGIMQRREYALILTGEHGAPLQELFRSRDHMRMFEILDEVVKVSGLPKRL